MKKEIKILAAIALAVILGAAVATSVYRSSSSQSTNPTQPTVTHPNAPETTGNGNSDKKSEEPALVRSDSYSLGPTLARVSIVEFLDPECESCKAFFPIMKQILKDYEGRIHFVVRYMGFHKSSAMAIAATEAAGLQGKYWEMQELLFEKAEEWGHQPAPDESFFFNYANALGLNAERFKRDLTDPRWQEKLERDMEDGSALGVRGTPTIFVNGNKLQDLSYNALAFEIDRIFAQ